MKIGPDGLPVIGIYSKDLALAGYMCCRGARFTREMNLAIETLSDACKANSINLEELGYTGEIDFLAREASLKWEQVHDIKLGSVSLLWINPMMLNRLSQDALRKFEAILEQRSLINDSYTSDFIDFKGKPFKRCVDMIAKDLKNNGVSYNQYKAAELLELLDSPQADDPDIRIYIPNTQISEYEKTEEEFAAFERFKLVRIGKRFLNEGDIELVQELAMRVSEEIGYLEVKTFTYNSSFGDFEVIVHRRVNLLEDEEIIEYYTPYQLREGRYTNTAKRLTTSYVLLD